MYNPLCLLGLARIEKLGRTDFTLFFNLFPNRTETNFEREKIKVEMSRSCSARALRDEYIYMYISRLFDDLGYILLLYPRNKKKKKKFVKNESSVYTGLIKA